MVQGLVEEFQLEGPLVPEEVWALLSFWVSLSLQFVWLSFSRLSLLCFS